MEALKEGREFMVLGAGYFGRGDTVREAVEASPYAAQRTDAVYDAPEGTTFDGAYFQWPDGEEPRPVHIGTLAEVADFRDCHACGGDGWITDPITDANPECKPCLGRGYHITN